MRIIAILRDARGDRRPFAEALSVLARRGHEVTVLFPRGAPLDAIAQVTRLEIHPHALPLGADGKEPPPASGIIHDLDERFRVGRAMLPHCEGADALLLDASSCLGAVAAHLERPRKVALLLEAPEVAASIRERNLHDDDHARLLSIAAVTEYTERRCDATIACGVHEGGPLSGPGLVGAAALAWARTRVYRPERTRVVEPACDLERAAAAQHASDLMEAGRPIIASLAPPSHGAGFETLARAFGEIRTECSRATLVVAGSDPHFFPARRAFSDVMLGRLQPEVRDAIIFRADDGPDGALAVLGSADLALAVSPDPGTGADVALALAAGVPLVAADSARNRAWLAPADAAVLVPATPSVLLPGTPSAAIARGAIDLWQDRPRALSQAARGRVVARERFAITRLADEMERALQG